MAYLPTEDVPPLRKQFEEGVKVSIEAKGGRASLISETRDSVVWEEFGVNPPGYGVFRMTKTSGTIDTVGYFESRAAFTSAERTRWIEYVTGTNYK